MPLLFRVCTWAGDLFFSHFHDNTSHYLQIKYSITKLEENGLPLTESLKVIEDLDDNLPIGGDVAKEVKQKLKAAFLKMKVTRPFQPFQKF